MSSQPQCRCGVYVHHGPVFCEECAADLERELVEAQTDLEIARSTIVGIRDALIALRDEHDALQTTLDALRKSMLIWVHGEPHYRSVGGRPMGMPDSVRRKVKRAFRDLALKPEPVDLQATRCLEP